MHVHVCHMQQETGGMKEVEGRTRAKYPLKGGDNRRPEKTGEKVEVAYGFFLRRGVDFYRYPTYSWSAAQMLINFPKTPKLPPLQ